MQSDNLDLELTIRQCRQGNPLAWEALVKNCQARVYGVSFYYLRNTAEAQEATQDVLIKVFNRLQGFTGKADAFLPWLLAIARNCCLDRLRSAKARSHYETEYRTEQDFADIEAVSPEILAAQEQRKRRMYQVLQEFSETNRDILLLKDIQGLQLEQVADILALPVGTVKSRSSRARIELAKRMAELGDDYSNFPGIH